MSNKLKKIGYLSTIMRIWIFMAIVVLVSCKSKPKHEHDEKEVFLDMSDAYPRSILADHFSAPRTENQVGLYEKDSTLAGSMMLTRANYLEWKERQDQVLTSISDLKFFATKIFPADSGGLNQIKPLEFHLDHKSGNKKKWSLVTDKILTEPYHFQGEFGAGKQGFLACTFNSILDSTVTVSLFGGDEFTFYCNGNPVYSCLDTFQTPEYWWHHEKRYIREKRFTVHQILVDVPVKKGKNIFMVDVKQDWVSWGEPLRVIFSFRPSLEELFWERLRMDFPEAREAFLDKVPGAWFTGDSIPGWFSANDNSAFENQFYDSLTRETGLTKEEAPPTGTLGSLISFAQYADLHEQLNNLKKAIDELERIYQDGYPAVHYQEQIEKIRNKGIQLALSGNFGPVSSQYETIYSEFKDLQRKALVENNPMIANAKIIFAKHYTYAPFHYYDEYNNSLGKRFGNSNICVLDLKEGTVKELFPGMQDGLFDRFDLSFDGKKIVFGYQKPEPEGMRLYESDITGKNPRQLTFPPEDEAERIARYCIQPRENLAKDFSGYATGYGHWTDDMHPCYLPDGRIVFVSTRSERGVLCGNHTLSINTLYRINPDGSALHQLSQGALHEYAPSIMNDGRIIYTRWEYVDKGVGGCQPMWAMRPDGEATEEIYGNTITDPGLFMYGKAIPGRDDMVVCTGGAHEMLAVGPILLIDRNKDKRDPQAMISITPEVTVSGMRSRLFYKNGRFVHDIYGQVYTHPYPLVDPKTNKGGGSFFLVSANKGGFLYDKTEFGIYLIDRFGNKVLIYEDPEVSCWQPVVLSPRETPPVIINHENAIDLKDPKASLFMTDIYNGLEEYGVKRGEVKYLRIWEYIARPWTAFNPWGDDKAWGQMAAISKHTHLWVQVLNGIVPVNQDGSAHFTVPADKMVFLQALDSNYQEIQRMRTYINMQPGEKRSCIGCHENRLETPGTSMPMAMFQKPVSPKPQPGEPAPRAVHYQTDVQPIWDKHCINCHGGKAPRAGLDLSGTLTEYFNTSYENIIDRELVEYVQEFGGPKKDGGPMNNIETKPPKTLGSHASKLVQTLKNGHHDIALSNEEWIKLVTWIDANAPYYGSYFGRRNIKYIGHPDFRPVPDLNSARGIIPDSMLIRLDEEVAKSNQK